jgi:hypothetical protein
MSKNKYIKNKWDYQKIKAEKNEGDKLTKPNQSMSIRDILFRNTNGMSYDNYKTPYYEEQATLSSEPLNKIQDMEPTEKLQYLSEMNTKVNNLKAQIKDHEAEKAAAIAAAQAANQPQTETTTTEE